MTAFCWGAAGYYLSLEGGSSNELAAVLLFLVPAEAALIGYWLKKQSRRWARWVAEMLHVHTRAIDAVAAAAVPLLIVLAAALGLYAELALIRLHASYFQLFSYFKNVSLLSCFLGLGIGYARAGRGFLLTPLVLPLVALQLLFAGFLKGWSHALFLQNPIPEQFSLGMFNAQSWGAVVAVFGFIGLVFAWNALCFLPLGQLAGRLMARLDKLQAYGWNLVGSLLGILLFNLVSFLWTPPVVWILLVTLLLFVFLARSRSALLLSAVSATVLLAFLAWRPRLDAYDVYSPYQKLTITYRHDAPLQIQVANVYYQRMLDLTSAGEALESTVSRAADYYFLPYRFKRDAERVLIVGSGTGNDVAAAVRHGVREIDAVEIDPAILALGKRFHPEQPYDSHRVNVVNNDARSYIRHTEKTYDLIVYGLLDSHTLLSEISNVRLDSFVYTVEALREARSKLEDGGVICITFSVVEDLLAKKIFLMLREAFDGATPLVFDSVYDLGISFIIGDDLDSSDVPDGIPFENVTGELTAKGLEPDVSTDDWPFFYMPLRKYPFSYLAMVLLLSVISIVWVLKLTPGGGGGFSMPCFFLGAGFMLIETKAITELALVFGSTWIVIGVVIAAILVMAYLANLVVIFSKTPPRLVTYGLLIAAVALGLALTGGSLDGLPLVGVKVLMTALLTLPLFFSGLAFSAEIRDTATVTGALASNILGAMLGGFLEYNSMYFGFRALYFLAIAMYLLAFIGSSSTRLRGR